MTTFQMMTSESSAYYDVVTDEALDIDNVNDILSETKNMLDLLIQHTQSAVPPNDTTSADTWRQLKSICDTVKPLISGGMDVAFQAPQLLVMGQPKCGKSSLINEILGQTIVRQSQAPSESPCEIRKLRYWPNPYERRSENVDLSPDGRNSDQSMAVAEFGLPNQLLQQCGLEIVDTVGSSESPPMSGWNLGDAAPLVIIYVISAADDISGEVEEDLIQLRLGCTSSKLIIVLNKIDADPNAAEAGSAATLRQRVFAKLNALGCCQATDTGDASAGSFFYMSCRKLKAMRRKQSDEECSVCDTSAKEVDRLRQTLLGCIRIKLKQQLHKLLPQLEDASKVFTKEALRCSDLRDSKLQAWQTVQDLSARIVKSSQQADSAPTLSERIRAVLKDHRPQILETMKTLELKEPVQQQQRQQHWAEAEIERKVLELQQQCCQEFAESEIANRLTTTDDVIAKLTDFQTEYFSTPLAPKIDRNFVVNLEAKKLLDSRKLSINKADLFRQRLLRQQPNWSDPKWRMDTAKKIMSSDSEASKALKLVLKQFAEQLSTLISVAQADTMTAVDQADKRVVAFLTGLKKKKKCLRESSLICLKAWLRLQSVLSESVCRKLLHQKLCCFAIGFQGNPVYAEKRLQVGCGKALVVKKIYLNDEDLSAMAAALHYSCTSTHDFLLRIEHLQLKKLSDKPKLWKLFIWTERMPQSLQQQLDELCKKLSLAERLQIGLRIAEALAKMHMDRQPHLNLQMSNIFVLPDNHSVRLADVGQSRCVRLLLHRHQSTFQTTTFPTELLPRPSDSASTGRVRSVNYASVDSFSLGAVLKALVLGCEIPPKFEESDDEISTLIGDCTQLNPDQRPTPADAAERLRQVTFGKPETNERKEWELVSEH